MLTSLDICSSFLFQTRHQESSKIGSLPAPLSLKDFYCLKENVVYSFDDIELQKGWPWGLGFGFP